MPYAFVDEKPAAENPILLIDQNPVAPSDYGSLMNEITKAIVSKEKGAVERLLEKYGASKSDLARGLRKPLDSKEIYEAIRKAQRGAARPAPGAFDQAPRFQDVAPALPRQYATVEALARSLEAIGLDLVVEATGADAAKLAQQAFEGSIREEQVAPELERLSRELSENETELDPQGRYREQFAKARAALEEARRSLPQASNPENPRKKATTPAAPEKARPGASFKLGETATDKPLDQKERLTAELVKLKEGGIEAIQYDEKNVLQWFEDSLAAAHAAIWREVSTESRASAHLLYPGVELYAEHPGVNAGRSTAFVVEEVGDDFVMAKSAGGKKVRLLKAGAYINSRADMVEEAYRRLRNRQIEPFFQDAYRDQADSELEAWEYGPNRVTGLFQAFGQAYPERLWALLGMEEGGTIRAIGVAEPAAEQFILMVAVPRAHKQKLSGGLGKDFTAIGPFMELPDEFRFSSWESEEGDEGEAGAEWAGVYVRVSAERYRALARALLIGRGNELIAVKAEALPPAPAPAPAAKPKPPKKKAPKDKKKAWERAEARRPSYDRAAKAAVKGAERSLKRAGEGKQAEARARLEARIAAAKSYFEKPLAEDEYRRVSYYRPRFPSGTKFKIPRYTNDCEALRALWRQSECPALGTLPQGAMPFEAIKPAVFTCPDLPPLPSELARAPSALGALEPVATPAPAPDEAPAPSPEPSPAPAPSTPSAPPAAPGRVLLEVWAEVAPCPGSKDFVRGSQCLKVFSTVKLSGDTKRVLLAHERKELASLPLPLSEEQLQAERKSVDELVDDARARAEKAALSFEDTVNLADFEKARRVSEQLSKKAARHPDLPPEAIPAQDSTRWSRYTDDPLRFLRLEGLPIAPPIPSDFKPAQESPAERLALFKSALATAADSPQSIRVQDLQRVLDDGLHGRPDLWQPFMEWLLNHFKKASPENNRLRKGLEQEYVEYLKELWHARKSAPAPAGPPASTPPSAPPLLPAPPPPANRPEDDEAQKRKNKLELMLALLKDEINRFMPSWADDGFFTLKKSSDLSGLMRLEITTTHKRPVLAHLPSPWWHIEARANGNYVFSATRADGVFEELGRGTAREYQALASKVVSELLAYRRAVEDETAERAKAKPKKGQDEDFTKDLAMVLKRLKKDLGASKVSQNYKGTGAKAHRRQLYVDFPDGAGGVVGIDLWLESHSIELGGVLSPISRPPPRVAYNERSASEVYEDVKRILSDWLAHRKGQKAPGPSPAPPSPAPTPAPAASLSPDVQAELLKAIKAGMEKAASQL